MEGDLVRKVYGYNDFWCDVLGRVFNPLESKYSSCIVPLRPYGTNTLRIKIHGQQYTAARIIADSFIPKPDGYDPEDLKVFHLNGVPDDNKVENLVWATTSEIRLMKSISIDKRRMFLENLRYEKSHNVDKPPIEPDEDEEDY